VAEIPPTCGFGDGQPRRSGLLLVGIRLSGGSGHHRIFRNLLRDGGV